MNIETCVWCWVCFFVFISSLENFACTIHIGVWRKAAKCLENYLAVYILEFIMCNCTVYVEISASKLFSASTDIVGSVHGPVIN